jgi:hypothetical protein
VKLPQFATTESISQTQLAPGSNFSLIITATSDQTTPVFIRAYINNAAPPNKQIWRSPEDKITEFPTGQAVTTTYPVHLPDTLKPGTYQVSYLLTSKDEQTDYLQKPNFAEFTVK